MAPPPSLDKKKKKKEQGALPRPLSRAMERERAKAQAAQEDGGALAKITGRRKEWAYVDSLKSRRSKLDEKAGVSAGAAREATAAVAFWPHCKFDRGAFKLDMPKPSVQSSGH